MALSGEKAADEYNRAEVSGELPVPGAVTVISQPTEFAIAVSYLLFI
jgi:hypothetical protein